MNAFKKEEKKKKNKHTEQRREKVFVSLFSPEEEVISQNVKIYS